MDRYILEIPQSFLDAMAKGPVQPPPASVAPNAFDDKVGSNQHYIPQQYIKKFLPDGRSELYRLDKEERQFPRIRLKTPRKLCSAAGFYDVPAGYGGTFSAMLDHIQASSEILLSEVYGQLAPWLDHAPARIEISAELRQRIALLLASLHLRTPGARALVKRVACQFKVLREAGALDDLVETFMYKMLGPAGSAAHQLLRRMGVSADSVAWSDAQLDTLAHGWLMTHHELVFQMARQLEESEWTLLFCPPDSGFVSSDNPVVHQGAGWGEPNALWAWPINPRYCLGGRFGPKVLNGGSGTAAVPVELASSAQVDALNELHLSKATRFVFGSAATHLEAAIHYTGAAGLDTLFSNR